MLAIKPHQDEFIRFDGPGAVKFIKRGGHIRLVFDLPESTNVVRDSAKVKEQKDAES